MLGLQGGPSFSVGFAHALVDGRIVELRVPYPMGFFAKQIDGRIDDPAGKTVHYG
ncbi:hypothetical protein JQ615_41455 [Bradyrhizobium jicamae]|uniref:Uncharacterized protein n=1 Tax=Bradyrhizobium jicamae TaxID=280332 RepID=A0ABS5FZ06_9BRAD|nr:hypothetical protein [Bradyrhizobium jicamae]MBR0801804.1 hypothetical protein [Bradyrhizobium jicamae]